MVQVFQAPIQGTPYRARAFRATASAAQSIANSAFTVVQFDTESFDTNNNFDNATNYNYTAPVAGYYLVVTAACFNLTAVVATTVLTAGIFVNGADAGRGTKHEVEALKTGPEALLASTILLLAAGDTVDFRVFQNSGGAQPLTQAATENHFSVIFLSP